MTAIASYDAVVIGGGLVGLPLAIALAQAGLTIAVVDAEAPATAVAPTFDGRVSAIAAAPQRLLAAIGVWDHVAEAEPIRDIRVTDGDSPFFVHYDHTAVGDAPVGWMLENRLHRQALFARLADLPSLSLHAPMRANRVTRGDRGVTVDLVDGRQITAALCIAADGRASPTRTSAGIAVTSWTYRQAGIVCTVAHEKPHRGVAQERFLPAGPFAILPMTGNRSSLVWTEPTERAAAIMALSDDDFAWEMRRRFGDHLGTTTVIGPRWSYPLTLQHTETYVAERLVLVGDAAHGMHPVAGQGLNAGLRDVAALAEILVDAKRLGLDLGARDLLLRYQQRRHADNSMMLAVTDGLVRLFSNDHWPLKLARNLGFAAVDRLPALKKLFMRHAMGDLGALPRLLKGQPL